jgi:hypothetical protein
MGARKLTAVVKKSAPVNDLDGAFLLDDDVAPSEDGEALGRVCLACGGDGHAHDGCAHGEIARLSAPSRTVHEAVARLRRAATEHRAAARALRVLVLTEVARERAELESSEPEPEPEAEPERAAPLPCPRCAEREAEVPVTTPPNPVNPAPRGARKRARAAEGQQAFTFGAGETRE